MLQYAISYYGDDYDPLLCVSCGFVGGADTYLCAYAETMGPFAEPLSLTGV